MAAPGYVTLICPPGAEQGPVSHGPFGWECCRDPAYPGRRFLVDVPEYCADHFCRGAGGFVRLEQ